MLYLTIATIIMSFAPGLIGNSLGSVDSFLLASLRLFLASLVFLPFLRLKYIQGIDGLRLFFYGFIQFGIMYVCYMKALQIIPAHLVMLFTIFTPIYVVLINDIRKRQFSVHYLKAAILSIIGAAVIKVESLPPGDIWIAFALLQISGIAFAFGQIAYRDWKQSHTSVPDSAIFALLFLGGAICAGLFSSALADKSSLGITSIQWLSIIYIGLVSSGLGFFLWNKGATKTNPGILAAFNNAIVPLSMLSSLFIFGEINDIKAEQLIRLLIGGLLLASAVFIARQSNKNVN